MQTSVTSAAKQALNYPEGHRKRTFWDAVAEYEGQAQTRPHRVLRGLGARVIRKGDPATLARMNEHVGPGEVVRFVVGPENSEQSAKVLGALRMQGRIESLPEGTELTDPPLDDPHNADKDWYVPTSELTERQRKEQRAKMVEAALEANGTHRIVEMTAQAVAAALAPVMAKAVADAQTSPEVIAKAVAAEVAKAMPKPAAAPKG